MKTKNQIVEILNKFFTPTCIASMNKDGEYSLIDTFEIIANEILQPETKELTAEEIKHKINQIICRYLQDHTYKTPQATEALFDLISLAITQQKEPLPRQMIRDIAVIYENYLQEWHLTDRDIVLLHALYAKIYDYIDQKQK
jgi:hypothetical protein